MTAAFVFIILYIYICYPEHLEQNYKIIYIDVIVMLFNKFIQITYVWVCNTCISQECGIKIEGEKDYQYKLNKQTLKLNQRKDKGICFSVMS